MSSRFDTVVIGAGQAGLATSRHLTLQGVEHVVLERGRIGETWRSQRWDGFFLNTPNWSLQLPGGEYDGDEPDAFGSRDQLVSYLEGYAERIGAPVRDGVAVSRLRRDRGRLLLETSQGPLVAGQVVVATGAFQKPTLTPLGAALPGDVFQLHTSEYRNPAQLPDGAVLVVGSGQSGCQIAEELLQAGRGVYLSVGRCPWFPRRLHGRDITYWAIALGLADDSVESLPSPGARLACNPTVSGNDGGHDLSPRTLAAAGAVLLGRIVACEHHLVRTEPGLEDTLAAGDAFVAQLRARVAEHLRSNELDSPEEPPAEPPTAVLEHPAELDLREAGIGTVVWANGFRPDLSWIELPLADEQGWPRQRDGLTEYPGLAFVGLQWLRKRKSALLFGVGEDAEIVAAGLASQRSRS